MDLSNIIKRFKIDLNAVQKDYADEPYITEADFANYKNGELDQEYGPPPDFKYENCSDKYIINDPNETNLYSLRKCNYYQTRVEHFYLRIVQNAPEIIGDSIEPILLEDVQLGEKSFVIGCFMKHGDRFTENEKNLEGSKLVVRPKVSDELDILVKDSNELYFEDSQQDEILLKGNIDECKNFTGLAVGIYGTKCNDEEFIVEKIILPSLPPYIERPLLEEDIYVIIVSGYDFFKACPTMFRELNSFCDILNSEKYFNKVARMIFAGNNSAATDCDCFDCKKSRPKDIGYEPKTLALRAANNLRNFFPHIDIDIMPGDADPAGSSSFPQQPMHKAFFENYDLPPFDEMKEEEKVAEIFRRKRKRSLSLDDGEVEIIEPKKVARIAKEKNDIAVSAANAHQSEDEMPAAADEEIIQAEDNNSENEEDVEAFMFQSTMSPTASEKRYSMNYSQDTVTLTDDSVIFEEFDAREQFYREHFNEEYGIAVDNWLLERVGRCPTFERRITPVPNPYCFKVMGIEFHGTSGQNVDSLRNLTKIEKSTTELMRDIIETGIIAPTAPDYLDMFPYNRKNGKDSLAFDRLPHVFFAGNQNELSTELVDYGNNRKVRLISISKYEENHSMVAVNLRTLHVSKIISNYRVQAPKPTTRNPFRLDPY